MKSPSGTLVEPLTRRERVILHHLAEDKSNREIATLEVLSLNSVKWYIQQIYGKLGVNRRREAIERARSLGLLPPAVAIFARSPSPSETPQVERGVAEPSPAVMSRWGGQGGVLPTGTVTFLFTDIEGSTPLWEQHPQQMAEALQVHNAVLRRAIEANGGVIFKTVGDAIQAVFNTAPQALNAAIEGQHLLQSASWNELGPLKVRMGLHTGEAELDTGGDEYAVSHTKNRIGRIHSIAYGGQILLSQETVDLMIRQLPEGVTLKDQGEHHLKGLQWPERLYQVCAPGLVQEFPPLPTTITRPNNLPLQLTSFIGREKEIAEICSLLKNHRLVTLTGSGGTGKTRLALAVAERVLSEFEHGIWLVDLSTLGNPELMMLTTAKTLGLHEVSSIPTRDLLAGYLKNKRLLLILDNCEHLLTECSSLADILLKACPQLHLMVTSREILDEPGEISFRVPPLNMPDVKHVPPIEKLAQFDAIRLFVERVARVAPMFTLNTDNAASIVAICHRLDGIPLALELTAARARVMAISQIAARLDNVFRLLTGGSRSVQPRQQTLKATMDWSYALLSEHEKLALQHMSVFSGSWTLEAAESIASGEGIEPFEVLDLLTALVDKSLILTVTLGDEPIRYRMLEIVRQYAYDHLLESRCVEAMRDRHLAYFLQFGELAGKYLLSKDQVPWLDRLEEDLDNLRLALEWSLTGHLEDGLRLVSALKWFWHIHNHHAEALQRLMNLLSTEAAARGDQPLAAGVQNESFLLAWIRAVQTEVFLASFYPGSLSMDQRIAMIASSISLCRNLGEVAIQELACGLGILGGSTQQEPEKEILYLRESLGISEQKQYHFLEAECLFQLASCAFEKGDFQQTEGYLQRSLMLCKKIDVADGIASRLIFLGWAAWYRGDRARARDLIDEGRAYYEKAGNLRAFYYFYFPLLYISPDDDMSQQAEEALAFLRETQSFTVNYFYFHYASVLWSQGNFEQAERYSLETIVDFLAQGPGVVFHPTSISLLMGRLKLTQGDTNQAGQYFKRAVLRMKKETGVKEFYPADLLDALSVWLVAKGKVEQAAHAFGALDDMYRRFESGFLPRKRSEHEAALATIHRALDDQAFTLAWEEGQAMTLGQAIEEVRKEEGWEDDE